MKTLIIVPAYKESQRLPELLSQIHLVNTQGQLGNITVEVVDDGSPDQESEAMKKVVLSTTNNNKWIQLQFEKSSPNQGKGAILRTAFIQGLKDNFDILGFLDADGATSFTEMEALLKYLINDQKLDAVIGSRWKCLGKKVERSLKRHLSGRIFATLVSNIFNIPVYDSQCGAKLFKSRILSERTLTFCDSNKWLFDTQLLILLYKKGANIHEHPVCWIDKANSKVSLIGDSIKMFSGLIKYKKKLKSFTQ